MNGAGSTEVVPGHNLPYGGGGIGGKVDRYHQGSRLAAAPVGAGGIRGGLGHVRASSIGVGRRWQMSRI